MVFFTFLIFLLFFWNFVFRVWYERNRMITFIFTHSRPFLTYFGLKQSPIMVCFNFFFFFEFSLTRRIGKERNNNFYFLSFSSIPNLFRHKMNPKWYFWIFWIFLLFFLTFYYASGRNETERWFLFSIFLILYRPILASNEAIMVFFIFIFFNF